ncbi:hypothetical protein OUZ56_032268 [Daphnia magna]|uniref:Uncharacterized protein n=1 Tax=Daphnia magna TaxID=35525 RepID=A0ABQ9ZWZ0_9CRUS|nr:hypothetical protein OUZ56_032268 [Daphnia magna]
MTTECHDQSPLAAKETQTVSKQHRPAHLSIPIGLQKPINFNSFGILGGQLSFTVALMDSNEIDKKQ